MEIPQNLNRIFHYHNNLYHLAPVPFIMYQVDDQDKDTWHAQLIEDAKASFSQKVLDVPDVKHVNDMGTPPCFDKNYWSEDHMPAIGVWHRVPTNQYLSLETPAVYRLRSLIEKHYIVPPSKLSTPQLTRVFMS